MKTLKLPEWAVPGASFDETYGNDQDKLWHVRGIVDEQAVCRSWHRGKQCWRYEVLSPAWFFTLEKYDNVKPRSEQKAQS